MSAQDGCIREKISDITDCARVVRTQREVVFKSHEWFSEELEVTLLNECDRPLSSICLDRQALSLNLLNVASNPADVHKYAVMLSNLADVHKYAVMLRAYGEDGSQLNIMSSGDNCLLEGNTPEHICFSIPEMLKPHAYYTLRIMYEGASPSEVVRTMSGAAPYNDAIVSTWNHYPPGKAPKNVPQALYIAFRTEADWLEIDEETARTSFNSLMDKCKKNGCRLNLIALNRRIFSFRVEYPANHQEPPIFSEDVIEAFMKELSGLRSKPSTELSDRSMGSESEQRLFILALRLLLEPLGKSVALRLKIDLFHKIFIWSLQILGTLAVALSLFLTVALLTHGPQPIIDEGLLMLTALFVFLLGNYLVLPRGGPLKYKRLDTVNALAAASVVVLGVALCLVLALHI